MKIRIKDMQIGQIYLNPSGDTYFEYMGNYEAKAIFVMSTSAFSKGQIIKYRPNEEYDSRTVVTKDEFNTLKSQLL